VSQHQSAQHVQRPTEATEQDEQVRRQENVAFRSLNPLTDVLSVTLLKQALVVWDAVFAVNEACHYDFVVEDWYE